MGRAFFSDTRVSSGGGEDRAQFPQLESKGHTALIGAGFLSHRTRDSCWGLRPALGLVAAGGADRQPQWTRGSECPVRRACRDPGVWGSHLWATEFSDELEVMMAPLPTPSEPRFSPLRQEVVVVVESTWDFKLSPRPRL